MDSVIMTTPGNSMRLRSRLHSAANTICARNSKHRSGLTVNNRTHNNNHHHHHHHHHRGLSSVSGKNLMNHKHQHVHKFGNVNEKKCNSFQNDNDSRLLLYFNSGTITREVHNAWRGRLGEVTRIPSDSIQELFNDMQLYPTKNQVLDMLQCARQCSRRNSSQFLTKGEFCFFAGELRRENLNRVHQHCNGNLLQKSNKSLSQCEVFLGGSCNPTTWRADIAIPMLSKLGITYYNPQVATWGPELMAAEHDAKESANVLLFVVDSQTRCVAGMLEVAYLVAKKRCLVLVVHPFALGQAIMGEILTKQEFIDLSEGQSSLLALVRNQGVTVHTNLSTALQCTIGLLRGPESLKDSAAGKKLSEKLIKLREIFNSLDKNKTGDLSLSDVVNGYNELTGLQLRTTDLQRIINMSYQRHDADNRSTDVRINFEQFCAIVAEFSSPQVDGCRNLNHPTAAAAAATATYADGANRFTNPIYWKLIMLRTQQLLRIYIVRPIVQIIDWMQRESTANNNQFDQSFNSKSNYQNITNGLSIHDRYDIYLGGSCFKRTTWRQNIAIPLLKRYGITYYNPSMHEEEITDNSSVMFRNGNGNDSDINFEVMNESRVVLFVITNETRSITSMILAAYYIAIRRNVVLCVQQLPSDNCVVGSDTVRKSKQNDFINKQNMSILRRLKFGTESMTKQAIKDYNRARTYLSDLAKHESVPVFENIEESVECAIKLVKNSKQR